MNRKTLFYIFSTVVLMCLSGCANTRMTVIPQPQSVKIQKGHFRINKLTSLNINTSDSIRSILNGCMDEAGWNIGANEKTSKGNVIRLQTVKSIQGISSPEGYRISVTPKMANIEAVGEAGLYYGLQTLIQMSRSRKSIPSMTITDEPRFQYRGLMIDVSRHFRSKEFIMKQIDAMAKLKLNRLHLHLTDAAGWRIEIKKYPRLTKLGAWRTSEVWKPWWNGGRKYMEEGSYGAFGGYYTQDDIREMVAYAQKHNIVIIPEIEMPAHSEEVLTAYPELSCTHEPYRQADFCVGNEKTFTFLEDVLTEVMQLFPSEYIHIGGDEAGKASWPACPLCQARMKAEGLKDVNELQSYLIHRIDKFLNSKGRKLLGWDEILDGGLAPNATVMSWRGEKGGLKAVEMGHRTIMSPGEYCYLDAYQDAPFTQPEAIGGYLPLRKVYSFNPSYKSLSAAQDNLIYGVQGNLWTEYVPTAQHAEYMLYPRAFAVAEVGWTKPENKDWASFHKRALKGVKSMKKDGYSPFNLKKEYGNRPEVRKPVKHLAIGKNVKYNAPFNANYCAGGDSTLVDGLYGGWSYNDKRWQGFISHDRLDVTIDMDKVTPLKSVTANFMQICGPEVFFPSRIIISVSDDGNDFKPLFQKDYVIEKNDKVLFENIGWHGHASARYIRYQAKAGKYGGFIFSDEIIVK